MMRKRQEAWLLIVLMLLLLTACSGQKYISNEPTDYTLAVSEGFGKQKILYLTAEHPDVKLVIPLVEQFLAVDQTQDHKDPNWDALAPLADAKLVTTRYEREVDTLVEHAIAKRLQDSQVKRIVFLGKKLDRATVTAELNVVYNSVGGRYAGWCNIQLNEPTPMEATIELFKQEDKWLVRSAQYSHLAPEGGEKTTAKPSPLTDIFTTLIKEQTPLRLTLAIGTAEENLVSSHDGWGCTNDLHLSNYLLKYNYESVSADEMPKEGPKITMQSTTEGDNWAIDFYEGSDYLQLEKGGKTTCYFATPKEPIGQLPVGTIARWWLDEAEWRDMGGSYESQEQIVIPNNGQDYLTASQEYCETFMGKHLSATSGSMYCYTYVSCQVEAAENITTSYREQGKIDENTYAFYLTVVFVPENERALRWSMAGNTGKYTGNDPDVPEGAYKYYRCGYITLADDGWHGNLVGTGW